MTRLRFAAALGLTFGLLATVPVQAWTRGQVDVLAVLPAASGSVEGITVGPDGNVYAPTFGFNTTGALPGPPPWRAVGCCSEAVVYKGGTCPSTSWPGLSRPSTSSYASVS